MLSVFAPLKKQTSAKNRVTTMADTACKSGTTNLSLGPRMIFQYGIRFHLLETRQTVQTKRKHGHASIPFDIPCRGRLFTDEKRSLQR